MDKQTTDAGTVPDRRGDGSQTRADAGTVLLSDTTHPDAGTDAGTVLLSDTTPDAGTVLLSDTTQIGSISTAEIEPFVLHKFIIAFSHQICYTIINRRMIAMSETERIIANVNATMAMEGMPLTVTDKNRIRDCIEGRKSFEETVKESVEYYKS